MTTREQCLTSETPEQTKLRQMRLKRLMLRFHKACEEYALLEDGDRILIGLSGGKDSLALVEILGRQARILKPRIAVEAVHVSVSNIGYKSDLDYLERFCAEHGVTFHHVTTSFERSTDHRKSPCFLCSWYRRKALFETAKALGCNKIAFGHHKDDIVETLLLNLFFQGNTETICPKTVMRKFPMQLIRPLCYIEEHELAEYAALAGYRKQEKQCPYEHESHRADVKRLVTELETLNPDVRNSVLAAAKREWGK